MDIKAIPIDKISLSNRTTNALRRANIHTVEDMLQQSEESLSQIRNLGRTSIDEIVAKINLFKAIDEEGGLSDDLLNGPQFSTTEEFDAWLEKDANKEFVINWLKSEGIRIEAIELLSPRAFNLLMFAEFDYVYQIAFLSDNALMEIPRMDAATAAEIKRQTAWYLCEKREDIAAAIERLRLTVPTEEPAPVSVYDVITDVQYHDAVLQYVKANDIEIERMDIPARAKNALVRRGKYVWLSDIILKSRAELLEIPTMGAGTVDQIIDKINAYLDRNKNKILAVYSGDEDALWDDTAIKKKILDLYTNVGFGGLGLGDIVVRLSLPETITTERIKRLIGQLIADNELEYVDYRCYRVYGRFADYVSVCPQLDDRSKDFINRRLQGETLESIAQCNGLTRERVRQVVKKDIERVRTYYTANTGMSLFDEDYYKYLYETYAFDNQEGTEGLGIPLYVWKYLDLNDVKRGKKDLQTALDDHNIEISLRLRIKNYLNRNKLYVDGRWVDKRRGDLEEVVARKFCADEVTFEEFGSLYNSYLEQEEIPYNEKLYYTEAVLRTRENRLSEARFILWKQNRRLRYYDIDGRDYDELLDTLGLDAFEDIEISTAKWMREYPEIMAKYDIRDQYELHNLLKKIVPDGSYHDFHCCRMPEIRFGNFDRDAAILDILVDNAPISTTDLATLIQDEYGYDPAVIMANYLQNFAVYYHQGIYRIDHKQMRWDYMDALKKVLTDDFYYIDEIRRIYRKLVPNADVEEINPYTLKSMGFTVLSRYALQNYDSLEGYYEDILTRNEITDITPYRKRFAYVQAFSAKLTELRRDLQVIEFEPNQLISYRKLERSGITRNVIQEFCDEVYEFVADREYFSIRSIKQDGYSSDLFDLGFSDWFYANLLISDDRFSYGSMFNNMILYKGNENITIKSFIIARIKAARQIDIYDLMSELTDRYGCKIVEKSNITYRVHDTEVYYDTILDRLYANKDLYYDDLEEGGI